jgi:hypothetical protein
LDILPSFSEAKANTRTDTDRQTHTDTDIDTHTDFLSFPLFLGIELRTSGLPAFYHFSHIPNPLELALKCLDSFSGFKTAEWILKRNVSTDALKSSPGLNEQSYCLIF